MNYMNYWNIQLHPNDLRWNKEKELLEKHSVIGLGDWEEAAKQQPGFEKTMQIGDIVLVKHGASIIALVEVTGDYEYSNQTDNLLWFERRRKVKVLDWYNEKYGYCVSPRKTLERCAKPNTNTFISIKQWIQRINNNKNMETYINLLIANYNLILTGAPGTGKTFLAKEIVNYIDAENERIGFVQFHPSYDYTDFIEGLRPIKENNTKEIGFQRKDGIFMAFCRKALKAYQEAENKKDAPKYVFIIDEINRGELSKIFGELFFSLDPGYRGRKGKVFTQYSNLWEEKDFFDNTLEGDERKMFYVPENVYIIGTMNDIDRSVESMDFAFRRRFAFKEIMASENTRMLDELNDEDLKNAAIQKMNELNAVIEKCPGMSSAYHIGASYFLKLNNYEGGKEEKFKKLWDNHICVLLQEYLRGLPNSEEQMKKMVEAYNK